MRCGTASRVPNAGVDAALPKAGVEEAPKAGVDEPVAEAKTNW